MWMNKMIENLNRKIKLTLKMEILKLKNTIAKTKNSGDNLNSKTEIKIKKSMSLNLLIHIIQSEKQREKNWTKRWTESYGLKGSCQKTKHIGTWSFKR